MIFIIFFSFLLLIVGFVWLMFDMQSKGKLLPDITTSTAMLDLGNRQILVDLAMDDYSRTRGLSGRDSLDADRGMYFAYDTSTIQFFWMFQMKFPLDIVFMKDDEVVFVAQNVPSPTGMMPPAVVNSHKPSNRILEINAGKAEEWGIKEGSKVRLVEVK